LTASFESPAYSTLQIIETITAIEPTALNAQTCPPNFTAVQTVLAGGEGVFMASTVVPIQAEAFLITFNYPTVTLSTISATTVELVSSLNSFKRVDLMHW